QGEVQIVDDDQQIRKLCAMPAAEVRHRGPTQVHVCFRFRQQHPPARDGSTANSGPPVLLVHRDAQAMRQPVNDLPPNVVAGFSVPAGRVSKSHDELYRDSSPWTVRKRQLTSPQMDVDRSMETGD